MSNKLKLPSMYSKNGGFTVEDGINVQTEQLNNWGKVLIPEVFDALKEYATRNNHLAKTGYDIIRGSDLSNYVHNYQLGHRL